MRRLLSGRLTAGRCPSQPYLLQTSLLRRHASYQQSPPRAFGQSRAPQQQQQQQQQTQQWTTGRPAVPPQAPSRPAAAVDPRLADYTLDEQITTEYVQVKDVTSNKLGDPQPLTVLLKSIDRRIYAVNQLSKPGDRDDAVVEIIQKDVLKRRVTAREDMIAEAQKASKAKKPKQIELNWAISENDLRMKLKQMQQFLEKGRRVEILLAAKKRARRATPDEAKHVVQQLKEKIEEAGAKEITPMEGKILGQAMLVVQKVGK